MEQPGAGPSAGQQPCLQEEWGWGQPAGYQEQDESLGPLPLHQGNTPQIMN